MGATLVPVKRAEPGSDAEELVCACGHTFTRETLDTFWDIEEFTWSGTKKSLKESAWKALREHATLREECPHCTCCTVEGGGISVSTPDEDEEQQWMCTDCLTIHDTEEEALDCCS